MARVPIRFLSVLLNLVTAFYYAKGLNQLHDDVPYTSHNIFFYLIPLTAAWATGLAIGLSSLIQWFRSLSTVQKYPFLILLLLPLILFLQSFVVVFNWPLLGKFGISYGNIWFVSTMVQFLFLAVFLPKSSEKKSFFRALLGLLSFIPLFYLFGLARILIAVGTPMPMADRELLLIPNDFKGNIRIIYGEPCAATPRNENAYWVYEVPKDGVIITPRNFTAGEVHNQYFFVDAQGKRESAKELFERQEKEKGVWCGSNGTALLPKTENHEAMEIKQHADCYVSNPDFGLDQRDDDAMLEIERTDIEKCRTNKK